MNLYKALLLGAVRCTVATCYTMHCASYLLFDTLSLRPVCRHDALLLRAVRYTATTCCTYDALLLLATWCTVAMHCYYSLFDALLLRAVPTMHSSAGRYMVALKLLHQITHAGYFNFNGVPFSNNKSINDCTS